MKLKNCTSLSAMRVFIIAQTTHTTGLIANGDFNEMVNLCTHEIVSVTVFPYADLCKKGNSHRRHEMASLTVSFFFTQVSIRENELT